MSESDTPIGSNLIISLEDYVHSMRRSEVEIEVQFRALESSNATVEAFNVQFKTRFDALFGVTDKNDENVPIVDSRLLHIGTLQLAEPLPTIVINDVFSEELLKCYTITILSPDVMRERDIFDCHEDENVPEPTDFYCLHTICILDDDGKQYNIIVEVHYYIYLQ